MWIRGRIFDWDSMTLAMLLGKDGAFLFIVEKGEGDGNEDEDGTGSEGGGVWESISRSHFIPMSSQQIVFIVKKYN